VARLVACALQKGANGVKGVKVDRKGGRRGWDGHVDDMAVADWWVSGVQTGRVCIVYLSERVTEEDVSYGQRVRNGGKRGQKEGKRGKKSRKKHKKDTKKTQYIIIIHNIQYNKQILYNKQSYFLLNTYGNLLLAARSRRLG
jgi:hypothetical protein